jgi:hypothetical protein
MGYAPATHPCTVTSKIRSCPSEILILFSRAYFCIMDGWSDRSAKRYGNIPHTGFDERRGTGFRFGTRVECAFRNARDRPMFRVVRMLYIRFGKVCFIMRGTSE